MTDIDPVKIGKYQILGRLGKGAMGIVYKARDPEIGRLVAIKTLKKFDATRAGSFENTLERFRQEARSSGILRHPNIITLFEVNCQGNLPYLVMDYVDGNGLETVIAKGGRVEIGLALSYLNQIASALDYAHGKGVIHRDIKPSNIIVDHSDTVFVLDFGVASINKSYQDWDTPRESVVMGTPSYMSPEQIGNQRLDRRSDIFSLAVVAFELFTGKRPFNGSDPQTVINNILNSPPLSLTALVPDLPLALEAEFERALAKNRDNRFGSAQEMVRAFGRALGVELPGAISLTLSGKLAKDAQTGDSLISKSQAISLTSKALAKSAVPDGGLVDTGERSLSEKKTDSSGGANEPTAWGYHSGDSPRASGRLSGAGAVNDPFAITQPSGNFRNSAGALFSHVSGSLTEEAAKNPVFVESSRSPVLSYLFALGLIALLGASIYLISGVIIGDGSGGSAIKVADQFAAPVVHHGAASQLLGSGGDDQGAGLIDPAGEPAPADTNVGDMSDKQLIWVLKSRDLPEIVTLSALKEAQSRRIRGLVDVSVYPLQSDSYVVRVETIKMLAETGDKRIVPHLMLSLDDHDPLVRGHAARALGILGDKRALAYLNARGMKEDSLEVKTAIAKAIERITGVPARLN